MRTTGRAGPVTFVLVAAAFAFAEIAGAQQGPGQRAGGPGGPDGGMQPGGPPMPGMGPGMGRGPMEPSLLANPEVKTETVNVEKGVQVSITSDNPELVPQIQADLPQKLDMLRNVGAMMRGRPDAAGAEAAPAAPPLDVQCENTDKGIQVTITSENADVVPRIQEMIPRMLERMSARDMRRGMRDSLELLLSQDVNINVTDLDNGISIEITSANPEVVEQLRQMARERMAVVEQLRARMQNGPMGGPGQGMMGQPGQQGRMGGQGQGMMGGQGGGFMRGGGGRGADPEMREMIRDEIRRYLEEEGKKQP